MSVELVGCAIDEALHQQRLRIRLEDENRRLQEQVTWLQAANTREVEKRRLLGSMVAGLGTRANELEEVVEYLTGRLEMAQRRLVIVNVAGRSRWVRAEASVELGA